MHGTIGGHLIHPPCSLERIPQDPVQMFQCPQGRRCTCPARDAVGNSARSCSSLRGALRAPAGCCEPAKPQHLMGAAPYPSAPSVTGDKLPRGINSTSAKNSFSERNNSLAHTFTKCFLLKAGVKNPYYFKNLLLILIPPAWMLQRRKVLQAVIP